MLFPLDKENDIVFKNGQDFIPKQTEILYFAVLVVEKLWNVLYHTILSRT